MLCLTRGSLSKPPILSLTSQTYLRLLLSKFVDDIGGYFFVLHRFGPLARDESAVFLLYLPTVYLFLSRLFALTKQLRPTLYLPVAATTSGE